MQQRGNIAVILLLVGVVIIGAFSRFNSLKGLFTSPTPTPPPVTEETYKSDSFNFEFKYAKELTAREDTEQDFNTRGNGDFRKNFKSYVGYEPGKFLGAVVVLDSTNTYDTNPFTVWVFDNTNNIDIDTWHKNFWYYPFVWGDFTYTGKVLFAPKDIATVSGQMAKMANVDYQPGKPKFIYLNKDKKMFLFRIIGEGNKILESFKFL